MRFLVFAGLVASLTACEPARQMQVRDGLHPSNIDKNVRFRTTYYFRTFDWCYGKGVISGIPEVLILPETDSLYRFRMTGKASALRTRVHFESGTLQASQIDPFGAKVVYDEDVEGFRFVSDSDVNESARRRAAEAEYKKLLKLYAATFDGENGPDLDGKDDDLKAKFAALLQQSLDDMTGGVSDQSGAPDNSVFISAHGPAIIMPNSIFEEGAIAPQSDGAGSGADIDLPILESLMESGDLTERDVEAFAKYISSLGATSARDGKITGCGRDAPVRRGFQIMGPEGWRTFNQDERLLMAMSTSDQPLISVMQQYSDRVLKAKGDATTGSLALAQESLRLMRAEREFDQAELTQQAADAAFSSAIRQLEEDDE